MEYSLRNCTRFDELNEIERIKNDAFAHFNKPISENHPDAADYGVTQSTIRAYRGLVNPLATYREWAPDGIDHLRTIHPTSQKEFLSVHQELAAQVNERFRRKNNNDLSVAQKYKLVDLLIKFAAISNTIEKDLRIKLVNYANVPLDKYTLLKLRDVSWGVVVADKPSMGNVDSEETYQLIQGLIRFMCQSVDVPNLYFEYWAWETMHT